MLLNVTGVCPVAILCPYPVHQDSLRNMLAMAKNHAGADE